MKCLKQKPRIKTRTLESLEQQPNIDKDYLFLDQSELLCIKRYYRKDLDKELILDSMKDTTVYVHPELYRQAKEHGVI